MLHQLGECNARCNGACSDPADRLSPAPFATLLERIMLRAGLWDASLATAKLNATGEGLRGW